MALAGALSSAPNPENPDAIEDGYPKRDGGPTKPGEDIDDESDDLLVMDPVKAAKRVHEDWIEQDQLHQRANAQSRANARRREGHVNVQVVKSKDEDRYEEWTWGPAVPHDNKAATLCRKATANLNADPPAPEPLPSSSEAEDVDAAEFSARVLENILGEGELDDVNRCRECFDLACTTASSFRYFRVEPRGRRQPLQIEAHPRAQSAEAPLSIPVPKVDVMGQPIIGPDGQPVVELVEQPPPYILRYVAQDGVTLTDKRAEAKMEWLPKIVDEILPAAQVRFLPATATFIDRADGVILGAFRSLGELKRMKGGETIDAMDEGALAKLTKYRPERPDDFLPGKGKMDRGALDRLKGDNRLVFCLTEIWRSGPKYPLGAYIYVAGDELILERGTAAPVMEDGSEEPLDIPLAQYLQLREGTQTKDGVAMMTLLGPGNEIRAAQLGSQLEYLDRFNSRKTFVPTSSTARASDLENPTKQYIPMNPGGVPVTEDVPEYPKSGMEIFDRAGEAMDHASGMEAAAQGLEDSSVQSGKHAQTIIGQVHAGLSEFRENIIRAETRAWRIVLQLLRAYYTKPQQLTFESKDGRTRQRRWSRADLGSTRDVRLKSATMTMMAPAAKLQFVTELIAGGTLAADEGRELVTSNLAKTLGWKDEPHRLRIKRQIADWEEGPPDGWAPPEPQSLIDPASGKAVLQPGPDPAQEAIWESVLADALPPVAEIRLKEIAALMASTAYTRWPREWRTRVDMEFQMMQQVVVAAQAPPVGPDGKPVEEGAPPK